MDWWKDAPDPNDEAALIAEEEEDAVAELVTISKRSPRNVIAPDYDTEPDEFDIERSNELHRRPDLSQDYDEFGHDYGQDDDEMMIFGEDHSIATQNPHDVEVNNSTNYYSTDAVFHDDPNARAGVVQHSGIVANYDFVNPSGHHEHNKSRSAVQAANVQEDIDFFTAAGEDEAALDLRQATFRTGLAPDWAAEQENRKETFQIDDNVLRQMFDMFSAADTDGDDAQLTKSEFLKNIRREDLDRVLRPIGGLDMRRVVDGWNGAHDQISMSALFDVLDSSGDGNITVNEFVKLAQAPNRTLKVVRADVAPPQPARKADNATSVPQAESKRVRWPPAPTSASSQQHRQAPLVTGAAHAVRPALGPVVSAFSRPDFVTFNAKRFNNKAGNTETPLWKARKAAARALLSALVHPNDLDRFAVAFLQPSTPGEELFELGTTALQNDGRVLIKATTPRAAIAALNWYLFKHCHVDSDEYKRVGLPAVLPWMHRRVVCRQISAADGVLHWQEVTDGAVDGRGSDTGAAMHVHHDGQDNEVSEYNDTGDIVGADYGLQNDRSNHNEQGTGAGPGASVGKKGVAGVVDGGDGAHPLRQAAQQTTVAHSVQTEPFLRTTRNVDGSLHDDAGEMARVRREEVQKLHALRAQQHRVDDAIEAEAIRARQAEADARRQAEQRLLEIAASEQRLQAEVQRTQTLTQQQMATVAGLQHVRHDEEQRLSQLLREQHHANTALEHTREQQAQVHATVAELHHVRDTEAQRLRALEQQRMALGSEIAATQSEQERLSEQLTLLLTQQRTEQHRLREYQRAMEDAAQVQLDEQRSEMTALERALQQRATEAEASLARLRAEEATLTADRTGADERLQRLEVDRALLQAQKERQMEVSEQYAEAKRLLDQEEIAIAAEEQRLREDKQRIAVAYQALLFEHDQVARNTEHMRALEAEVAQTQTAAADEAAAVRERMLITKRAQVLEDKRQQMNMERELLRLEEEQMQQSQRHLAQQAAEGARITAEAAALQAQVDTMAHRNRQAEVDNALRRTTVTMPAPPPDTPPHGGTMAVRGHAHLMSTPTHRSMDESMSVVQALDAQDDAAPQQRWLHPSQDRGDSGGRPSPGRYQQVRRKVQTVGVAPRAPGPARDGYSAMNVPALEIEMDRLLEASTYQALFDYDARTADEVSFRKGDLVLLLEKTEPCMRNDPSWLRGMVNGTSGYFPANRVAPMHHVRRMHPEDHSKPPDTAKPESSTTSAFEKGVEDAMANLTRLEAEFADFHVKTEQEKSQMDADDRTIYERKEALVMESRIAIAQQKFSLAERLAAKASMDVLDKQHELLQLQKQASPNAKPSLVLAPRVNADEGTAPAGGDGGRGDGGAVEEHTTPVPLLMDRRNSGHLSVIEEGALYERDPHASADGVDRASSPPRNRSSIRMSLFGAKSHKTQARDAATSRLDAVSSTGTSYDQNVLLGRDYELATMFGDDVPADMHHETFGAGLGRTGDGHVVADTESQLHHLALMRGGQALPVVESAEDQEFQRVCDDFLAFKRASRLQQQEEDLLYDKSLHGCLDIGRYLCYHLTSHPWFDGCLLLVSFANIITLAMYDPRQPHNTGQNYTLNVLDFIFLGVYVLDFLCKVTAQGLIWPRNIRTKAYLLDPWSWLDMIVIVAGTVEFSYFVMGRDAGVGLAALRAIRVLRVARIAGISTQLRLVVNTLYHSVPVLASVLAFSLGFLIFYVLLGMLLYMGTLDRGCYYTANGTQVGVRACGNGTSAYQCETGQVCLAREDVPVGYTDLVPVFDGVFSFNDAGHGFYLVFVTVTLEGWSDFLYALNDAVGPNYNWLYFVTLIAFSSYVLLNLIRGTIASEYMHQDKKIRRKATSITAVLYTPEGNIETQNQVRAAPEKRSMNAIAYSPSKRSGAKIRRRDSVMRNTTPHLGGQHPTSPSSAYMHEQDLDTTFRSVRPTGSSLGDYNSPVAMAMVKSAPFEYFITLVILTNAVFLGLNKYPEESDWQDMLDIGNYVFVSIYIAEMLVKMYGYGFRPYFDRQLNQLDFVVVVTSVVEFIVVDGYDVNGVGVLAVFAVFRLLRLFKLMAISKKFRDILLGLIDAFHDTTSLIALIALFVLVMALLGKEIFGDVFASARFNYNNFANALIVTFQLLTVEGWNNVIATSIVDNGGAQSSGATSGLFFVAAIVLGDFVLISIFLAIAVRTLLNEMDTINSMFQKLSYHDIMTKRFYNQHAKQDKSMVPHTSLLVFGPTGIVRRFFHAVMWNSVFEYFMLFVVLVSTAMLGAYDYTNSSASRNDTLRPFEQVFAGLFALEAVVKIIALGFVLHPRAYLRSLWNTTDFVIVILSIIALSLDDDDLQIVRIFLAVRIFRALRFVRYSASLRESAASIVGAVRDVWALLLMGALLIYCFAVVGVSAFKGRFSACTLPQFATETACVSNGGQWETFFLNFDNVINGFSTLLSISTMEGWVLVYYRSADATGQGTGPQLNNNQWAILFYVVYIIVIAMFFINVVLAFVVVVFARQSHEKYKNTGLSAVERKLVDYVLRTETPKDPTYPRRQWLSYRVAASLRFDLCMMVFIVGSTVTLLMQYDDEPQHYSDALFWANVAFIALFAVEAAFKLFAFGSYGYFYDPWNKFDFLVVVGGVVELALSGVSYVAALRLVRLTRILKLFKNPKLELLMRTLWDAMVSVLWVTFLLVILFYIYAVIGMALFAKVARPPGSTITEYNNFDDLQNAFLLLFRVTTGEGWQSIMDDCDLSAPVCDSGAVGGSTCGSVLAPYYFFSFVIICTVLLINVFVAVILDAFEFLSMDHSIVTPVHLNAFVTEWRRLDPQGTGRINHHALPILLRRISPPLGLGRFATADTESALLAKLPVGIDNDGLVDFRATLLGLVRVRLDLWLFVASDSLVELLAFIAPSAPLRNVLEACGAIDNHAVMTVSSLYLIRHVQRAFRQRRVKQRQFAALRDLELTVRDLQTARDLAAGAEGAFMRPEQRAARQVSLLNLMRLTAQASRLRRLLVPHEYLADVLTREFRNHVYRVLMKQGLHTPDEARAIALRQRPGNIPHPQAMHPGHAPRLRVWAPPAHADDGSTVVNPLFDPRDQPAPPVPSVALPVPTEAPRVPTSNGAHRSPPATHVGTDGGRYAPYTEEDRRRFPALTRALTPGPPVAVPPPRPTGLAVPTQTYPPSQQWRALLAFGHANAADIYRGPPPAGVVVRFHPADPVVPLRPPRLGDAGYGMDSETLINRHVQALGSPVQGRVVPYRDIAPYPRPFAI